MQSGDSLDGSSQGHSIVSQAERFAGAACFLMGASGLILEVQKLRKWRRDDDGRLTIGLGLIGGSIEHGESPIGALQREAHEEIGCSVQLVTGNTTVEVSSEFDVWTREWTSDEIRPLLVWQTHGPWDDPDAKVAVYIGRPGGIPKPRDLPAIISLGIDQLPLLGGKAFTVAKACAEGAELVAREPIPPRALLEPTGTLAVLHRLHATHGEIAKSILAEVGATVIR